LFPKVGKTLAILLGSELADSGSTLAVAQENLNAAFSLTQSFLTFAREANALLEEFQTFFERQVAFLKLADDLLERLK
jgi:hypothetical protein